MQVETELLKAETESLKERIIRDLIAGKQKYKEAAKQLGVTTRTVHNYFHRFKEHGPEGLKDRRTGNHRKLTPEEEAAIVACKQERPQRSARFIRDRLGLKVSAETVRLVLVKHHLNRRALERRMDAVVQPQTDSLSPAA